MIKYLKITTINNRICALLAFGFSLSLFMGSMTVSTAQDLSFSQSQEDLDINYRMNVLQQRIEELEKRLAELEGGEGEALNKETSNGLDLGVIRKDDMTHQNTDRQSSLDSVSNETALPSAVAFDLAYGAIVRGEYGMAQQDFSDFLIDYPDDPLTSRARYWLGESYFANGLFQKAATLYLNLYKEDIKGEFAPSALFMLARSLKALDQPKAACATFDKVSKEFSKVEALPFVDILDQELDACANL